MISHYSFPHFTNKATNIKELNVLHGATFAMIYKRFDLISDCLMHQKLLF